MHTYDKLKQFNYNTVMYNRSKPYTCNNKLIKSRTNNQYNNSVTPNQMIIRAYMQNSLGE